MNPKAYAIAHSDALTIMGGIIVIMLLVSFIGLQAIEIEEKDAEIQVLTETMDSLKDISIRLDGLEMVYNLWGVSPWVFTELEVEE